MQVDPNEPSRGLGDDIAKITHATRLDKVAMKIANLFGKEDCGCDERRELLNKIFPYTETPQNDKTEGQ